MPARAKDQAVVTQAVTDPATLVDTRTWTTGGGNTFPGAEAPFGMVQWSPDTMPGRNAGGGYTFGDTSITGYSLTHVSGPGCGAGGDVPILPVTGALPSGDPNNITTKFTNTGEVAQAGYYSAQTNQPDTITSEFTATPHSSMGRFTYPTSAAAGMLIKLHDSQNGESAPSTAQIVGNNEIVGSQTSGHFCGEANNDGQQQEYTVHFDMTFDQPFTASQIVTSQRADRSGRRVRAVRQLGRAGQGRHLLRQQRQREAGLADGEPGLELRRRQGRGPAGLERVARPDPGRRR